jgi:hypothetical protein
MPPHPDFVGRSLPREASCGPFTLNVLEPADVDEDFAVVIDSVGVLGKLFDSDWPQGLTLERNLADLTRHKREFDDGEAFAWIIRELDGTYLGCAYVRPLADVPRTAKVYTWVRRRPDRLQRLAEFNACFRDWLDVHLPEHYGTVWKSND